MIGGSNNMTDWEKKLNEPAPTFQRVAMPVLPLMIKVDGPKTYWQAGKCEACNHDVYPEVVYNIEIGNGGKYFCACSNASCYAIALEKVLCELLVSSIPGLIVDREMSNVEASELLNMTSSYLIILLAEGEVKSLRQGDVLTYKATRTNLTRQQLEDEAM